MFFFVFFYMRVICVCVIMLLYCCVQLLWINVFFLSKLLSKNLPSFQLYSIQVNIYFTIFMMLYGNLCDVYITSITYLPQLGRVYCNMHIFTAFRFHSWCIYTLTIVTVNSFQPPSSAWALTIIKLVSVDNYYADNSNAKLVTDTTMQRLLISQSQCIIRRLYVRFHVAI